MDQELISYFDTHFRGVSQQISQVQQQVVEVQRQVTTLREETAQRFKQVDDHIKGVEGTCQQSLELAEGFRRALILIAEGLTGFGECLRRYDAKTSLSEVIDWLTPHFRRLETRVSHLECEADRQRNDAAIRRIIGQSP